MASRPEFESATRSVDAAALRASVARVRQGGEADRTRVAAAMAWAGFACPGAIEAVYASALPADLLEVAAMNGRDG